MKATITEKISESHPWPVSENPTKTRLALEAEDGSLWSVSRLVATDEIADLAKGDQVEIILSKAGAKSGVTQTGIGQKLKRIVS